MGPNGTNIDEKFFFDPTKSCGQDFQLPTGSRKTREIIQRVEIRGLLDSFSGKLSTV